MPVKEFPFTKNTLERIAKRFPTPFHIYDEMAIRKMHVISFGLLTGTMVLKSTLR